MKPPARPEPRVPDRVVTAVEAALAGPDGPALAVRGAPPPGVCARARNRYRAGPVHIVDARRVGGGCVSPAARIELDSGMRAFVKWHSAPGAPADFFAEEARSLARLRAAGTIRVPEVLAVSADCLVLEWLEPGRAHAASWRALGSRLAELHRHRADTFGWPADNYIGSLPQANGPTPGWSAFWRDRRLAPQFERAYRAGHFDGAARRRFEQLLDSLDEMLWAGDEDGASLLHGDLWSGNVHVMADGAALIDPSSYYGHREVDLAMAQLFGGFPAAFFEAYDEAWPVADGYRETRRAIYQLYYLLVHVNLFGSAYVPRALDALAAARS